MRADRGPWYDWPLELVECEYDRETRRNRSLIEGWFGLFKYRTGVSGIDFYTIAPLIPKDRGSELRHTPKYYPLTLTPLVFRLPDVVSIKQFELLKGM